MTLFSCRPLSYTRTHFVFKVFLELNSNIVDKYSSCDLQRPSIEHNNLFQQRMAYQVSLSMKEKCGSYQRRRWRTMSEMCDMSNWKMISKWMACKDNQLKMPFCTLLGNIQFKRSHNKNSLWLFNPHILCRYLQLEMQDLVW